MIETVVGVALGFGLSEAKSFFSTRRRRIVHWKVLKAEVEFCSQLAKRFLDDNVVAPLYRLPTQAFSHAFPQLLVDAKVSEQEMRAVQMFFSQVEALNRGFEQVELARFDSEKMSKEYSRNRSKAELLLPRVETRDSYFTEAHRLLQERCGL